MIIFENPGELDIAAISTFGVSVKETDNPIGFFGTGLKYAIAVLLRTHHSITVWSGVEKHTLSTEPMMMRGKEFQAVTMDGQRLGFTTEVGKTWELWMAYRELFCNARDENGDAFISAEFPIPTQDRTYIAVDGVDFEAVHQDRWKYFIEDEPDAIVGTVHVWFRPSVSFFYRGMKVSALPRPAMFTYSETAFLELTEDRSLKRDWEATVRVAQAMLRMTDESTIRRIVTAPETYFEGKVDCHGWGISPSQEFLKTIGDLASDGCDTINPTVRRIWSESRPEEFNPKPLAITHVQQTSLDRALDFCGQIGIPVRGAYPIVIVETLGSDVLGRAFNETIYIAERAFEIGGAKQVASTLIEEFVHLRHKYADCTRPMQSWLFEKLVSIGEELVGEPL